MRTVAAIVDAGEIKLRAAKIYPLAEVAKGWREIHSNPVEGKVVFEVVKL